jgi:osmotically inducible protein OsmC
MIRKGSAHWAGALKDGKGTVTTESGALQSVAYSFATRFGEQKGTNPEELVAAAHAACFSMSLASKLASVEAIDTTATITIEHLPEAGFSITQIHLDVAVRAPGIDRIELEKQAKDAKLTCPISRLLTGARITMEARLV